MTEPETFNTAQANATFPEGYMPFISTAPQKSVLREYFEQGLITVVMALFLMTFIAQAVQVPTGSMQNNIHIGDHFFVNKFVFGRPTSVLGKLLPTREIKSPVRLPPKNSSDNRCKCAYVSFRSPALTCSLTRART